MKNQAGEKRSRGRARKDEDTVDAALAVREQKVKQRLRALHIERLEHRAKIEEAWITTGLTYKQVCELFLPERSRRSGEPTSEF